jgi:EAL domain-containing protein (putative c-di-GMP-specific phosphodiesterase class I)
MQVVTEGAETEGQIVRLISYSCDMIQGFYFSKLVCSLEAGKFLGFPIELQQEAIDLKRDQLSRSEKSVFPP